MKKRNMKYMALLLTLTMVFTSNVFAFGENTTIDVEAVEDEAPEVVGLITDGSIGVDYQTGFGKGAGDRVTDDNNGDKKEYEARQEEFKKTDGTAPSIAYQAGYYDGYSGEQFQEFFEQEKYVLGAAFRDGYDDAISSIYENGKLKAVADTQATDDYGTGLKNDKLTAYKTGYDSGAKVGEAEREKDAYQKGFDEAETSSYGWDHFTYFAKNNSFFETDDFKNDIEDAVCKDMDKDKEKKEYLTAWKKGYQDAYDLNAAKKGYKAGREDGMVDVSWEVKKPSDVAKDKLDDYITNDIPADYPDKLAPPDPEEYRKHWKTYNPEGWEWDDPSKKINGKTAADIVGETYKAEYKKGYDDAYSTLETKVKNYNKKEFFTDGFQDGYYIGQKVGETQDESIYRKDMTEDTGVDNRYFNKANKDTGAYKDSPYLQDYKDGYEFGYNAAFKTSQGNNNAAYNEGYNDGFKSGKRDGEHDKYEEHDYDGYCELYDPKSAYNTLTDATKYGAGYRQGYYDGYWTYINDAKNDHDGGTADDLMSSEFDAWRISSDPATWDTAQLLIGQNDIGHDGKNVYDNYYFNTYNLWRNWYEGENVIDDFTPEFMDKDGEVKGSAKLLATSPFQYYFDLYANDHLVDKKTVSYNIKAVIDDIYQADNSFGINNGSVGMYNYAALPVSGNKAKKGVSSNGTPYVIVRYRIAGAETDENYKVRRFTFDANGNEKVVTDHITDYYIGEDGKNEPVVPYDSRKIAGKKLVKKTKDQFMDNDKKNRYIIDAEALLITWEPGKPAVLVGPIDVDAKAKNNVNATVSHNFLNYKGETEIAAHEMPNELHHFATQPYELIQTDKGVDPNEGPRAEKYFSRYYKVDLENEKKENDQKDVMARISFTPAENIPKLAPAGKGAADINASSAFVKANKTPSFTLKAKKLSPTMKPYAKGIKKALKSFTANFEISRMKMASDYVDNIDTVQGKNPYNPYRSNEFSYTDTEVVKLVKAPVAPKRSDFESDEKGFKDAVQNYVEEKRVFDEYKNSDAFKAEARKGFQKAIEAYRAYYEEMKTKYGDKLDYFKKWIEEEWVTVDGDDDGTPDNLAAWPYGGMPAPFPYTVTKEDRGIVPVGNTAAYKTVIPEDANCNGIITASEFYEHETYGPDDPRFDGVIQPGDNVVWTDEDLLKGTIDWEDVTVTPNYGGDGSLQNIEFHYTSYDSYGNANAGEVRLYPDDKEETGEYFTVDALGDRDSLIISVFYDFLEDRDTDIEIVEDNQYIMVLWPGAERLETFNGAFDDADIDFLDPKVKGGKKGQTLNIKPVLHLSAFAGWDVLPTTSTVDDPIIGLFDVPIPGVAKAPLKVEKKLKTSVVKADKSGVFKDPKPGKADLLIKNYMAEIEPFIVVTGVNNYEGQIAIRQRQNGDIGYGYFKNDDFYYIYNDEE